VIVVHICSVTIAVVPHLVPGSHGGVAPPPEHSVEVCAWQTMSLPQSLSVVHGPG
jgi:hypothetical protein